MPNATGPTPAELARPIDFELLATRLRLLETSPSWSEVQGAMAQLTQADARERRHQRYASDASVVRAFAEMLVRTAPLLADALACAAIAGRLSDTASRRERILRGLYALTEVFDFRQLATPDVARVVADVRRELDTMRSAEPAALPEAPPLGIAEGHMAWTAWLRDVIDR